MRTVEVEELKKIQLSILDEVDRFCRENNIKYWLDSGTLIGAIRHGGYIPWDDDIDLGMTRENYNKFQELFNKSNKRYQFYTITNNAKYLFPFGKVVDLETRLYEPDINGIELSINIDIFPYDVAPKDFNKIKKCYKKRDLYRRLAYAANKAAEIQGSAIKQILVKVLRVLLSVFPNGYFEKKIIKNAIFKEQNPMLYINAVGWGDYMYSASWVDEQIDWIFEGKKYRIPKQYDSVLRSMYGDYMQFPPEAERVTHHHFVAFKADNLEKDCK